MWRTKLDEGENYEWLKMAISRLCLGGRSRNIQSIIWVVTRNHWRLWALPQLAWEPDWSTVILFSVTHKHKIIRYSELLHRSLGSTVLDDSNLVTLIFWVPGDTLCNRTPCFMDVGKLQTTAKMMCGIIWIRCWTLRWLSIPNCERIKIEVGIYPPVCCGCTGFGVLCLHYRQSLHLLLEVNNWRILAVCRGLWPLLPFESNSSKAATVLSLMMLMVDGGWM
jgi:hypothetical protein